MSSTAWPFFTSMTCESPSQATYRVRPRRKVTTPVVPQRTFCQHNASTQHNVSTAPQLSGYPGAGETPPLGTPIRDGPEGFTPSSGGFTTFDLRWETKKKDTLGPKGGGWVLATMTAGCYCPQKDRSYRRWLRGGHYDSRMLLSPEGQVL